MEIASKAGISDLDFVKDPWAHFLPPVRTELRSAAGALLKGDPIQADTLVAQLEDRFEKQHEESGRTWRALFGSYTPRAVRRFCNRYFRLRRRNLDTEAAQALRSFAEKLTT